MTSETYLDLLGILVFVVCLSAVFVMSVWTLPNTVSDFRHGNGAERTYSGWVLFRALICFGCLVLFALVGLLIATMDSESVTRTQITRHSLVAAITGIAALGLSGPFEKRSIRRAIENEQDGLLASRLEAIAREAEAAAREAENRYVEDEEHRREVRERLEQAASKAEAELRAAKDEIVSLIRREG